MRRQATSTRAGFTLVELLVVIVIIGILASLVAVAVTGALDKAKQTAIKMEMDQLAAAMIQYKNTYGSYPPNCESSLSGTSNMSDFQKQAMQRHIRKAFPRSRDNVSDILEWNMTPAEAVFFWLGGFSSDPEHPFSGPGGPAIPAIRKRKTRGSQRSSLEIAREMLQNRNGLFEFDLARFTLNRSDPVVINSDQGRYLVYLWVYHPAKLEQPYVYFDTSRDFATTNDPSNNNADRMDFDPQYRDPNTEELILSAYRQADEDDQDPSDDRFVNPKSFQIISAGTDDDWGQLDWFTRGRTGMLPPRFPLGPFTGGLADNLVNFSPRNLEDSQP